MLFFRNKNPLFLNRNKVHKTDIFTVLFFLYTEQHHNKYVQSYIQHNTIYRELGKYYTERGALDDRGHNTPKVHTDVKQYLATVIPGLYSIRCNHTNQINLAKWYIICWQKKAKKNKHIFSFNGVEVSKISGHPWTIV